MRHGVTIRSAAQTESKPSASARRAASTRTVVAARPEIGRKTPNFTREPPPSLASRLERMGGMVMDHQPFAARPLEYIRREERRHGDPISCAGENVLRARDPGEIAVYVHVDVG